MTGLLTEPRLPVAASPLTIGSKIFVDLPEHGISADFAVREIRPCPTPSAGDGHLVTTKFIHENAEILDLRIEGADEPIGTTASHPFWSEDRQQFVAAGELRVGENLLLADETTRRVESITLRPTRETVYNIEVDGEHVFYVGEDGVLVHNSCGRYSVYVLKDKYGNVTYWGITKQKATTRALQHWRDGKRFHKMTVLKEKLTRRQARNIEGTVLNGAKDGLKNELRPHGGYYHAYPDNPGTGRRLLGTFEINSLLENPVLDIFIK